MMQLDAANLFKRGDRTDFHEPIGMGQKEENLSACLRTVPGGCSIQRMETVDA